MAPGGGVAPDEVLAPPARDEDYVAWRASTDLRAPHRVAPEFLAGTKADALFDRRDEEAPLIVFINARSGGRVGPELANVLARALGRSQVFDLACHRPDTVLARIWSNFDAQEAAGNARAARVRARLRILACGGDGTVAWILKAIQQLRLQPQPPVAVMPLGTGNDLSRSFSWGAEFDWRWIKGNASVYSTLKRVADARVAELDCWRLRLVLPGQRYAPAHTYAMTAAPADPADAGAAELAALAGGGAAAARGGERVLLEGLFWNYFSVGADAQAAYNFHHLRDAHPGLAAHRVANQFWYSTFSCTSGWFCGGVPSVSRFGAVQVLQPGASAWSALPVPPGVKALVLVNLQSYGGGRNIWGASESRKKSWHTPSVADGLIEVVGFTHGYHALAVMGSHARLAHGKRIAQVAGIRLALRAPAPSPDGGPGLVYMQLDGEPWQQDVPAGSAEGHVVLEVVQAGTSRLLLNSGQPADHPVSKVTRIITPQQAAAYCSEAPEEAITASAAAAAAAQQQREAALELVKAQQAHWQAGEAAARGAAGAPEAPPLEPAAHARAMPGGGGRAISCDGGLAGASGAGAADALALAACTSISEPGTAPSSLAGGGGGGGDVNARRSLQLLPGGCSAQSSPGGMLESPSAVAVIEALPTPEGLGGAPAKPHHLAGRGAPAAKAPTSPPLAGVAAMGLGAA
ncbi:DGK4 [Scenedesmus sp. PABB004]|nr:DGK4 [Scenedesmus sp. PABB004]